MSEFAFITDNVQFYTIAGVATLALFYLCDMTYDFLWSRKNQQYKDSKKFTYTFVIHTKNDKLTIEACLKSITALTEVDKNIIVIDESTDKSSLSVAKNYLAQTNLEYKVVKRRKIKKTSLHTDLLRLVSRKDIVLVMGRPYLVSNSLAVGLSKYFSVESLQSVIINVNEIKSPYILSRTILYLHTSYISKFLKIRKIFRATKYLSDKDCAFYAYRRQTPRHHKASFYNQLIFEDLDSIMLTNRSMNIEFIPKDNKKDSYTFFKLVYSNLMNLLGYVISAFIQTVIVAPIIIGFIFQIPFLFLYGTLLFLLLSLPMLLTLKIPISQKLLLTIETLFSYIPYSIFYILSSFKLLKAYIKQ